jgi:hypothetical protein
LTGRTIAHYQILDKLSEGGMGVVYMVRDTGYPNPSSSIWRIPPDRGEGTQVLDGVATGGMQWTVAEGGIYFLSKPDDEGRSDLSLYDFATRKTRVILTIERTNAYGGIAVSPDQRTILFSKTDAADSDLMQVENFR